MCGENSSLGASFALGGNFGEQQTHKSSFIPKISSKYTTSTANTRICDSNQGNSSDSNESKDSPSLAEGARGWVKTPSLRDSAHSAESWQSTIKIITQIAILFLALFLQTALLSADESFSPNHNHAITILSENDAYFEPFIKSDKYYTGGHYVSYLSPEFAQSWVNKIAGFSHLYDRHFTRFAVALKQEIYTPDNKNRYDAIAPTDDMLFGAGLYGSLAIINRTRDFMEQFSLDIGVVGPLAFGGETQNFIHRVTKNNAVWGWGVKEGALQNEVLVNLHYGLIWRWVFIEDFFDVLPHFQISLGNALTAANVGIKFRVGYGIKNDFGSPKFKSRFHQNIVGDGLKIYAFFGASGSAVARDMFIQGNTSAFTRGTGVKSAVKLKHFFYDIEAGFMVGYKYFSLGYVWSDEAPRFREQGLHHQYGSIRLEIMF